MGVPGVSKSSECVESGQAPVREVVKGMKGEVKRTWSGMWLSSTYKTCQGKQEGALTDRSVFGGKK